MNLFCSPLNLHYLCSVLFLIRLFSRPRIKRETGEIPVQSRCCKLHKIVPFNLLPLPLRVGRRLERGESEDLQDKLTLICSRGKDASRYLFFILFLCDFFARLSLLLQDCFYACRISVPLWHRMAMCVCSTRCW